MSASTATNPAENTRALVIERVFPHSPQKLWRALTESTLLAQWMMNNDFEPAVGRKFQFRADPMPNWNGIVDCEVLIVEPVSLTLTPTDGGTRLRMEQSGFAPHQQAAYQGANYGWQKFFNNLEQIIGELDPL